MLSVARIIALATALSILTACGSADAQRQHGASSSADVADESCLGPGMKAAQNFGPISGQGPAVAATAGELAAWKAVRFRAEGITETSPKLDAMPDNSPVAVCLYYGEFVTPVGPPGPEGQAKPQHDTIRLFVFDDGSVQLDAAGYKDTMLSGTPNTFDRFAK